MFLTTKDYLLVWKKPAEPVTKDCIRMQIHIHFEPVCERLHIDYTQQRSYLFRKIKVSKSELRQEGQLEDAGFKMRNMESGMDSYSKAASG